MNQLGLFDLQNRLESLEKVGDPLLRLNQVLPWDSFRPLLSRIRDKERKSPAGRKPFDELLLFKMLILQRLYNLSDHQVEFQVRDRLSFMRFLGLGIEDKVPDEKTLWAFREELSTLGLERELMNHFNRFLNRRGIKAREGHIVDATFVEVPRQRNTVEENQEIKEGKVPDAFSGNPHVLRQKDTDARWTKKRARVFYGYKNHVVVDAKTKLVTGYEVTPAQVHDSQKLEELLKTVPRGSTVYGDSAYADEKKEMEFERRGIYCLFSQRDNREWKDWNKRISRIRCRVEHVFGWMEKSMGGKWLRAIGLRRNRTGIGMMNLVYNMKRYAQVLCTT